MLSATLRSLGITLIVSCTIGAGFYAAGASFWKVAGGAFAIQIVLFFLINYFSDIYVRLKSEQILNERMKEFTRIGAQVNCSFCDESAFVPIDLSNDNIFKCEKCGNNNLVVVNLKTVQTTEPIMKSDQDIIKEKLIKDGR